MVKYRKARSSDAKNVAKIHAETFKNFFLSSLGSSFLITYYNACIKSKEAISICALDKDNNVVGFCFGTLYSKGFNKRLILNNFFSFTIQTIRIIFYKPKAIIRLFENLNKEGDLDDNGDYSELLSIGVTPDQNGLGIGQQLIAKFENQVRQKGVTTIALTTDADSNDSVLRFYKKSGYIIYYNFETYPNRKMLKLIKQL